MAESSSTKAKRVKIVLIWTNVAVGALALFVVLAGGVMVAYARTYENRIFPGVQILGVQLDGLTKEDAQKVLDQAIDKALSGGLRFRYQDKDVNVPASTVSADAGASRDLVQYQIDDALKAALLVGREGGWISRAALQTRLRVASVTIPANVTIDREAVTQSLNSAFQDKLSPPKDASLTVSADSHVAVVPEQRGTVLLPDTAFAQLEKQAKNLDFEPIQLSDRSVQPSITAKDVEALIPAAQAYIARPTLTLTYKDQRFVVPTSTLAEWLVATGTPDNLGVTIDPERFAASLPTLAPGVEVAPKDGSLVIKDGKIDSFVSGMQGLKIDATVTLAEIMNGWPKSSSFPIAVTTVSGKLTGEDPERLGIKDLLGVGTSNFSGSPSNRIKNITHGAALVNGSIIQPGQEFSLLKTLGPIDGAHNWLPELVIKGNETKPEFGGGLCQIGTTTFRGALASGLPITERQNHSYRVRYYEPAGLDATIYDPRPDFRFQNDTGHPVLINAYIKGNDVFFEFWGTKDGRTEQYTGTTTTTDVALLKPRVYNVTQPPPTKLVETLDLAPGKKKCTEVAHAGADTDFSYMVTYANGEIKTTDFHSHYRPWQAVCLIGVEHLSKPADATTDEPAVN